MFKGLGIFSLIFNGFRQLFVSVAEKKENEYYKQKTYDPITGLYYDRLGSQRRYSDDKYVSISRDTYGDIIYRCDDEVRNLSQEEREKNIGSVIQIPGTCRDNAHMFVKATGIQYRDIKNGSIYVIRRLKYDNKWFDFYMDIDSGKIIRPTDGQLKKEDRCKELNKEYYDTLFFNKAINYFNSQNIDKDDKFNFYRNKFNGYDSQDIDSFIKYRKEIQ